MDQNCDFQVRGYSPPCTKKFFLCRFAWFRTWKKKNWKSMKMTQFCPDPPPISVKFHTFFFWVRTSLMNIGNLAKNVILGVNNTPNLSLKLMYFFCFWSYKLQSMSKTHFSTLGAIFGGRGWGKNCPQPLNDPYLYE